MDTMHFNHPPPPPSQLPSVCLSLPHLPPNFSFRILVLSRCITPPTGARETHGMGSKGPLPPEIKGLLLRVYDSGG